MIDDHCFLATPLLWLSCFTLFANDFVIHITKNGVYNAGA
ncbi:hypothetical protein XF_1098 [Xylella fastidiosa 9a5c]|uniref:Uncharacterized protein n=1 Tax=Xylella fastidiosa (strain 9a5c) TaxID=160492 RepID=Q9PED0_XYLFA|nr:hypothetical protein XF_1098 [Xylella fastidiosa 9a5c]